MATREEALIFEADEESAPSTRWRWIAATATFCRRKPLGAFGAVVLLAIVVVALVSPWIARYPYEEVHLADGLTGPSGDYWFGTNKLGQDVFSRAVIGTQITVLVGLGTVMFAAVLSLVVGGLSGYIGGRLDMIVQRAVDVWIALPALFLLLTVVAVLGTGGDGFLGIGRGPDVGLNPSDGDWIWYTFFRSTVVIFALGLILAGYGTRVIRSAVLALRENVYVEAARALGATDTRIVLRYILPNVMPILIILATLNLGTAVLAEATISFLGFGVQAPFPTWGQMLAKDGRLFGPGHEYLMVVPGVAIFVSVYAFNMLGDALRDVLDPRLRGG
jgi:peptide/nickel transport system permease protein